MTNKNVPTGVPIFLGTQNALKLQQKVGFVPCPHSRGGSYLKKCTPPTGYMWGQWDNHLKLHSKNVPTKVGTNVGTKSQKGRFAGPTDPGISAAPSAGIRAAERL